MFWTFLFLVVLSLATAEFRLRRSRCRASAFVLNCAKPLSKCPANICEVADTTLVIRPVTAAFIVESCFSRASCIELSSCVLRLVKFSVFARGTEPSARRLILASALASFTTSFCYSNSLLKRLLCRNPRPSLRIQALS